MKNIVFFFLVFGLSSGHASELQLGTGSLTPHFSTSKKNYCNQWNNSGIIVNKTYYARYTLGNVGLTYITGNDSICSPIEGILFNYIFSKGEWNDIGITFGGYAFDEGNWDDHADDTPSSIDAPAPVQVDYFGRTIVPVIALDVGIHLIRRDNWSLKLNNLFTPVIFNHSLAFEWRFK